MAFSLVPDILLEHYSQVTPAFCREYGIRLLLTDLDFTLAPKSVKEPDEALCSWIRTLKEQGIAVCIVSNNHSPERVERFCSCLGIPYQGNSGKPSTRGLVAAMQAHGFGRENTAMLGDKLLTDCLAAKRAGVLALTVEPLGGAVTRWQKVLHAMQAPFKALCRRKKR